ncbi:hypothetical protein EV648_105406 [Kribbella sp. VKM Ac-2568]|nr:hypothetical protein EV648_105406 [Kribbella sp. VKM Ac-2568]
MNGDREWRDLLIYDLTNARLCLGFSSLEDNWTEPSDTRTFATPLGSRFLRFMSAGA